ncbi:MAG: YibE/F family protein [Gaiellaceae bacterium]
MRRRHEEPEIVDEGFWGRTRPRLPVTGSWVVEGLVLAVVVLAIATLVGLVILWPHGKFGRSNQFGPIRTVGAVAEKVDVVPCALSASHTCRVAHVRILDGPEKGTKTVLTTVAAVGSLDVAQGDRIRVYKNTVPEGTDRPSTGYSFADFDRRGAMLWLGLGFIALLLATGRVHGLRALVGLLASLGIIIKFVVPAILHGSSPFAVAVVGAFAVMLVMMPLSYGLGAKALAAWLGTAVSLMLAAGLAYAFAHLAHLSGASSDESVYLGASQSRLSLQGLLVAGMVIGALGVLVDLTVSQSSTVIALRRANPSLGFGGLFRGALEVGQDHIAATVATLVFAYAGAALPVLLIFSIGGTSFADAFNGEAVADEVIAALVGSIGLIASMPITTALAALLAPRMSDKQLGAVEHAQTH